MRRRDSMVRVGAVLFAWVLATFASAIANPEKVSFPSSDGDLTGGAPTVLRGLLYRPTGKGPFPAVVALHGCNGLFTPEGEIREHYATWGRLLSDDGYLVLLVDSFGPRGFTRICGRQPVVTPWRERPRDAYGGLLFLQTRSDVLADRVALLGWSHGGGTVLWTVAESNPVRPERLAAGDFRAAVAFYPGCQVIGQEPSWSTRIPLLTLMGVADNWTPAALCEPVISRARAAGAPVELVLYPNAYHGFDIPNLPVRQIRDVILPDGTSPSAGTNPEAREKAIERLRAHLGHYLKDRTNH